MDDAQVSNHDIRPTYPRRALVLSQFCHHHPHRKFTNAPHPDKGEVVQNYTYSAYGNILAIKDRAGVDQTSNPGIFTSYAFAGRGHFVRRETR
jgi:hypothetical protein